MPPTRQEKPEPRPVEDRAAYAEAAADIAGRARRRIDLLSYDLADWAYGTTGFCDGVRDQILGQQRARVRALVHDVRSVAARDNRLLHLLRHVSSFTEIRVLAEHQGDNRDESLIADERHLLERDTPESPTARLCLDMPVRARAARRRFDGLWDAAAPATELRRLYI